MESLAAAIDALNVPDLFNTADWLWPVLEMFHFCGMAMLIGTIGLIDARVLGFFRGIPIASLEKFVWLGVAGFIINAVTGVMFVAGNPIGGSLAYLTNFAFQIKVVLMLIAGINLLAWYATGIAATVNNTAPDGDVVVPAAKVIAGVSLVMWFGVIVFGRLIMYNDTLLYALGL